MTITGTEPAIYSTFHRPCLECGATVEIIDSVEQSHDCKRHEGRAEMIARAYWAGHDRALGVKP